MAKPTIASAAVPVSRERVIVTCNVDAPPLKNLIAQPLNGWSVWVNRNPPLNGNETPATSGAVATPGARQVTLFMDNFLSDTDDVRVGFNESFGDTYDNNGLGLTTVLPASAIRATFDPVSAAGCLTLPMANLMNLLANSAAWQSWLGVGAGDATAAATFIHLIAPTPPAGGHYETAELVALRNPAYAKIEWGGGAGTWNSSRMANGKFTAEGQLQLTIEARPNPLYTNSERNSEMDFLNKLEAVITDLARTDEGLGFLVPNVIAIAEGPRRAGKRSKSSEGDYYMARLSVGFNSPL